jgi:hypothetical protein
MADHLLMDAYREMNSQIEKAATNAFPDASSTPIAVAEYVRTPEGRELWRAASVVGSAGRR